MKYILLISSLLLLLCCNATTKSIQVAQKEFKHAAVIDSLADIFLIDTLMNSLSIGIYYKGEKFTKHYGEIDPGKNNKPSNKTIYDIGSVSKTFVGTLIANAAIEGKLSIEDDIRDYLDGAYPNLAYENQAIKIKHLITHTSRLPRFMPVRILDEFNLINADLPVRISKIERNYSKQQFLEDLKNIEIDTIPGFNYSYSNAGGELASYILERVYGMSFEKLLEEKLLKAAKMTSTAMQLSESQMKLYANGYGDYKNLTPPMKTSLWGGSGHGKSTVADLLNYIKYHLNTEDPVVQKSHQILFDKDIIDGDPRNKMAYMWQSSTNNNFGQYIKHHGGAFGTQNWLLIYPKQELGITILTNQSGWHTAGKLINVVNGILNEIAKDIEN